MHLHSYIFSLCAVAVAVVLAVPSPASFPAAPTTCFDEDCALCDSIFAVCRVMDFLFWEGRLTATDGSEVLTWGFL